VNFISTKDLKDIYNQSYIRNADGYATAVKNYLLEAIKRHNTKLENYIVVGLTPDYRVAGVPLYTQEDTTAPLLEVDYGLLKNTKYSVPRDLIPKVEELIDTFILGLSTYGFTVEPFWAYARSFDMVDYGITYEGFRPVKCYKIKWSNT
jgi:hypothetical protein